MAGIAGGDGVLSDGANLSNEIIGAAVIGSHFADFFLNCWLSNIARCSRY